MARKQAIDPSEASPDPYRRESRLTLPQDDTVFFNRLLEQVGIKYVTLVDGSFATTKEEPGDVDLCILFDADEVNRLVDPEREAVRRLMGGPACKPDYLCDVYGISIYPFDDPRFPLTLERVAYWTRVFGTDRQDRQKSFLLVNERGVL